MIGFFSERIQHSIMIDTPVMIDLLCNFLQFTLFLLVSSSESSHCFPWGEILLCVLFYSRLPLSALLIKHMGLDFYFKTRHQLFFASTLFLPPTLWTSSSVCSSLSWDETSRVLFLFFCPTFVPPYNETFEICLPSSTPNYQLELNYLLCISISKYIPPVFRSSYTALTLHNPSIVIKMQYV